MGQTHSIDTIDKVEFKMINYCIACIYETPNNVKIIYTRGRQSIITYDMLIKLLSIIDEEELSFSQIKDFMYERDKVRSDDFLRKKIRLYKTHIAPESEDSYRIYMNRHSYKTTRDQIIRMYNNFESDGTSKSIDLVNRLLEMKHSL